MKSAFLGLTLLVLVAGLSATSFDDAKAAFGRQEWKQAGVLFSQFLIAAPDDPLAPAAAFLRGVALFQAGDPRGALDAFQKLDRTWPQSEYLGKLPYWKGTAALAAGQNSLAERELEGQARFPDQEPFTTRAVLNLALARLALGKTGAAIEALEAFTSTSREPLLLAQAWALWADEDKKAGRGDAALEHYRLAWETGPLLAWDLSSRTLSIDLLNSLGRFAEAQRLLLASQAVFPTEVERWSSRSIIILKALGDREGLARLLEERWRAEKNAVKKQEWAVNRAKIGEELGQTDSLWWSRASSGPDEALGGQSILRAAYWIEKADQWLTAAQTLETWLQSHPSAPADKREEVLDRAALGRLKGADAAGALRLWDRLIAGFPKSLRMPQWLLDRGRSQLAAGDPAKALTDFSRILKDWTSSSASPEARYQTGMVYLARQEPARAEAWFFGLVQDLKQGELYQRALLARGVSFVNAGQADLARSSLQRLIRETPQGIWVGAAWSALGRNAMQARLFEEAVDAFGQAEASYTDDSEKSQALWSRSEALAAQGKTSEASAEFSRFAGQYPGQARVGEALYRQGSVYATAKDWTTAYEVWKPLVDSVEGRSRAQIREGMATALLKLGRPLEGWEQLRLLDENSQNSEVWYRWGQNAATAGLSEWAIKAYVYVLQTYPTSKAAEAALPRAAGALMTGGQPEAALGRYEEYFRKFGRQPASAPVAKAAAAAAQAFPQVLGTLVQASKGWALAPEVSAEFALAWSQARLDTQGEVAVKELQSLGAGAPWSSQRSEALSILGRWHLANSRMVEARTMFEAAAQLGDDLSIFRARSGLAMITEKQGDLPSAAKQKESTEKTAGPGVPLEFRIQLLKEAADLWSRAGRAEEGRRVLLRIQSLSR